MVKRCLRVCGRLLTVCIVIYRYVLVLHSSLVETSAQKRTFQSLILATIFLLPVLVSSYGVYYRNHYYNYLGRGIARISLHFTNTNILHIFQSVQKDSMSFSTTLLISTRTSPSPGPAECTGGCTWQTRSVSYSISASAAASLWSPSVMVQYTGQSIKKLYWIKVYEWCTNDNVNSEYTFI